MQYEYRNILKEPPAFEELQTLASMAGMEVAQLLNPKSKGFKDKGLKLENISSPETGEIIAENPRIMYRPLLTDGEKLVVGFKPEEMEKLF